MPILSPREELLDLQRSLYDRIRADIDDFLGKMPPAIARYRAEYNRELTHYEKVSNKSELIREVMKSDTVYLGDYHSLRQSQRTVIKILRELVLQGRKIILAVEMVHHEDQALLNRYLQGVIGDDEFLKAIDYQNRWSFEWNHYKQLFDFAKKYKIAMAGLNTHVANPAQALRKRDKVASQQLFKLRQQNPDALILVLYGDLHIASSHIPHLTAKLEQGLPLTARSKPLIIYQNSDELYWLLAENGLEQKADVVKLAEGRYCVLNTPPWVKLQTYLNWLEHRHQWQPGSEEEFGDSDENYDYYHRLWDMADTMATFLKIPKEKLGDFNVFTSGDPEFMRFLNGFMKKAQKNDKLFADAVRNELITNGTCMLPKEGLIYLSTLSINKSSEKIAQFIHARASASFFHPKEGDEPLQLYFGRVLLEAIGYIGSKILNYKRKCELIPDYRRDQKTFGGKTLPRRLREIREMGRLVLFHHECAELYLKRGRLSPHWRKLYHKPARLLYGVSQSVGQILGEHLYEAVIDNRLDKSHIRQLFLRKITGKTDNRTVYLELISKLQGVHETNRSKSERF